MLISHPYSPASSGAPETQQSKQTLPQSCLSLSDSPAASLDTLAGATTSRGSQRDSPGPNQDMQTFTKRWPQEKPVVNKDQSRDQSPQSHRPHRTAPGADGLGYGNGRRSPQPPGGSTQSCQGEKWEQRGRKHVGNSGTSFSAHLSLYHPQKAAGKGSPNL